MSIVELKLPHDAYSIHIGPDLLNRLGELTSAVAPHGRAALLADGNVYERFGNTAEQSLRSAGYELVSHLVQPGEDRKELSTVRGLYDVLVAGRLERSSPVIALSGGVVGDMVGFLAASYLRGVPLVQCPTTLVAMVDASVGGKVGVNLPQGKNLVGSFYQPRVVVIDTQTLLTLPKRELRCGLAECVKHGMIRDADLVGWTEDNLDAILAMEPEALVELVDRNVRIKADVVMADEKEAGERAHLNFGHTFAHAIEATAGFGEYHHGEAVALGMIAAANLAADIGRCKPDVAERLVPLLERIGLPTDAKDLAPTEELMASMQLDKKVVDGKVRFVLPDRVGAVSIVDDAAPEAIASAWDSLRR